MDEWVNTTSLQAALGSGLLVRKVDEVRKFVDDRKRRGGGGVRHGDYVVAQTPRYRNRTSSRRKCPRAQTLKFAFTKAARAFLFETEIASSAAADLVFFDIHITKCYFQFSCQELQSDPGQR